MKAPIVKERTMTCSYLANSSAKPVCRDALMPQSYHAKSVVSRYT
jgi:hypothetical protein